MPTANTGQKPKCDGCKAKRVACVTGTCQDCGGGTPYRAHKLCYACAEKQGVCAMCLAPLPNAKPNK